MTEFLLICFCASLCVLTLHTLFNDGESILGWFPYLIEKTFLNKLRKPLYDCLVCMSSIWGSLFFYILSVLFCFDISIWNTLIAVFVIAGFGIIYSIIITLPSLILK